MLGNEEGMVGEQHIYDVWMNETVSTSSYPRPGPKQKNNPSLGLKNVWWIGLHEERKLVPEAKHRQSGTGPPKEMMFSFMWVKVPKAELYSWCVSLGFSHFLPSQDLQSFFFYPWSQYYSSFWPPIASKYNGKFWNYHILQTIKTFVLLGQLTSSRHKSTCDFYQIQSPYGTGVDRRMDVRSWLKSKKKKGAY